MWQGREEARINHQSVSNILEASLTQFHIRNIMPAHRNNTPTRSPSQNWNWLRDPGTAAEAQVLKLLQAPSQPHIQLDSWRMP